MNLARTLALSMALVAPFAAGSALAQTSPSAPPAPAAASKDAMAKEKDIVDLAASEPTFSTLVTAVKAAGLVDALKGKGPLTVFAPTDEAFKKLPAGTLDDLLKPENKAKLVSILKYHAIAGRYDAGRITKASAKSFAIPTLEGPTLTFDLTKGVKVGGATVTRTDFLASNGVIHAVDMVLLPPAIKRQMFLASAKAKAAELAKKAVDTTKAAAGKVIDAGKAAADKVKELAKPAETAPAAKKP